MSPGAVNPALSCSTAQVAAIDKLVRPGNCGGSRPRHRGRELAREPMTPAAVRRSVRSMRSSNGLEIRFGPGVRTRGNSHKHALAVGIPLSRLFGILHRISANRVLRPAHHGPIPRQMARRLTCAIDAASPAHTPITRRSGPSLAASGQDTDRCPSMHEYYWRTWVKSSERRPTSRGERPRHRAWSCPKLPCSAEGSDAGPEPPRSTRPTSGRTAVRDSRPTAPP
jgi:hypothetical protein